MSASPRPNDAAPDSNEPPIFDDLPIRPNSLPHEATPLVPPTNGAAKSPELKSLTASPPSNGAIAGGKVPVLDASDPELNPFKTRSRMALEPVFDMPEVIVDYTRLVWSDEGRHLPPGVNAAKLEAHLSEGQFVEVMGMEKQQFYNLSKVEQMRIKQDVGLF